MKKILNKKINGQAYIIYKYGLHLGSIAYAKLYIDTHKYYTKEMSKQLRIWINTPLKEQSEVEKIIELELKKEC